MGINFRRTTTAALTASAVLAMTAVAVAPAEAATVTVSGTVKLGSPVVAADDLQVLLCAADCVNSSSDPAASDFTDSLGSYSMSASTGTYAVVVYYLSDQPGYDFADDPAYLKLDGSKYTVTTSFAEATKLTVGSANLTFSPTLEPPVTNAQARFTQSTTGSVGYLPCAGHTTTAKPTPFSPSSAHLSYQWLWADSSVIGSSTTVHTIAGATRASYTRVARWSPSTSSCGCRPPAGVHRVVRSGIHRAGRQPRDLHPAPGDDPEVVDQVLRQEARHRQARQEGLDRRCQALGREVPPQGQLPVAARRQGRQDGEGLQAAGQREGAHADRQGHLQSRRLQAEGEVDPLREGQVAPRGGRPELRDGPPRRVRKR